MSVRLMSMVFDMDMPDMSLDKKTNVSGSSLKFVLLSLADHANDQGESSYPSMTTLSYKTNLSRSTCINGVNVLKKYGFVKVVGSSKWKSNIYWINIKKIKEYERKDDGPATGLVQPQDQDGPATGLKPSLHPFKNSEVNLGEPTRVPCDDDGLEIPQKPPKKRRVTSNPQSKTPAIMAFRLLTGKYPKAINYQDIIDAIGDEPDEAKLAACYKEWCGRGYNPASIKWATEWYKTGIPSRNGNVKSEPKGMDAVRRELERLERVENGG